MRRILIVDDEQPVASGIAHIIRRDFSSGFEIAGLADSGREAIDKVLSLAPDIILMDVRMPGFSGMDAIRELRKKGTTAAFIMITAYERFEIAREAIELGVVDYLLKPVSTEALASSLAMAVTYLDQKDELERNKLELRESLARATIFAEKALLLGIMAGAIPGEEIAQFRKALGLQGDYMVAAALGFGAGQRIGSQDSESSELYWKAWKAVKYKSDFLAGPLVSRLCLVLMPLKEKSEAGAAFQKLESILKSLAANGEGRGHILAGYGTPRSYDEANQSWNEAISSLYSSLARRPGQELDDSENALLDALLDGSKLEIQVSLDAYVAAHNLPDPPSPVEICAMISLIGGVVRKLVREGRMERKEARELMSMEALYHAQDASGFAQSAKAKILLVMKRLAETSQGHSRIVATAMSYVHENYGRQINLERAAGEIGISPNRLSRLFVEETGKGFSKFLIQYRIGKAKEMLALPGASVKEISMNCGYPDQNYFARLFKKVTGLTPSSFCPANSEDHDGLL